MCFLAGGGLFQADLHGVREVIATVHLPSASRALAAEDVAKNVAKRFAESTKTLGTGPTTHVGVHAGMAVLIVSGTLLRVAQHFIGLFGLFEFFFGCLGRISLVAVRVVLHRQFAISLLDFVVAGVLGNAQHFIKVSFGHLVSPIVFEHKRRVRLFRAPRGGWNGEQLAVQAVPCLRPGVSPF